MMFSECPVCTRLLQTSFYENIETKLCSDGCGGIWLDQKNLAAVTQKQNVVEHLMNQTQFVEPLQKPDIKRCPSCKTSLQASLIQKASVEIDSCPSCLGIWLDKGEIATLSGLPGHALRIGAGTSLAALAGASLVDGLDVAEFGSDVAGFGIEAASLIGSVAAIDAGSAALAEGGIEVVASALADGGGVIESLGSVLEGIGSLFDLFSI